LKALVLLIYVISLIVTVEVSGRECKYYRVKKGDSWWKIAKREGISIKKLRKANPRLGKYLKVGQRICIPVRKKVKKRRSKYYTTYIYYRVKRGDTLSEIAQKYRVSVKAIKKANGLRSSKIYVGQVLRIPIKKKKKGKEKVIYTYVTYRVKKGDTLIKIARRFGISYKRLMKINKLKSTKIRVGQRLKVPVRERVVIPNVVPEIKLSLLPVEGKIERASNGVNIYADCGSEVRAVKDGKVIYAGDGMSNYGNLIILDHGNFMTLYAYNSEIFVKQDQKVKRGEVIGKVGRRSPGDDCFLRFEIRAMDGSIVNTLDYIEKK